MSARTFCLIWHPTDDAWLLVGGTLPQFLSENLWKTDTTALCLGRFGVSTRPLFRPWADHSDEQNRCQLIVMEALGALPDSLGDGARWHSIDSPFDEPEPIRAVLETLRAEAKSGWIPELRPDWARRGFLSGATAFFDAHVDRVGPIESVRAWSLSCVLKAPTASGTVFFKAANPRPLFVNEGVVTANLARRFPGAVPSPISVAPDRGWMLLDDLGPSVQEITRGDSDAQQATSASLLEFFARLQFESAGDIDGLLAGGLLDRRLPRLIEMASALPGDPVAMSGLTDDERGRLSALLATVPARVDRVSSGPMPPDALVHGDLHAGNVAPGRHKNGPPFVVFDWTDACVSHPLFDLLLVHDPLDIVGADVGALMLERVIGAWSDLIGASRESLSGLWSDIHVLLCLHHAVSYAAIDNVIEPWSRHESWGATAQFLRDAIRLGA